MKIPREDILKVEKQKTWFIMNNCIELTTKSGKIILTSFFSRDMAYDDIIRITRPGE